MSRNPGHKPTHTLWIFCEGETERFYFQKLKFTGRIGKINVKLSKRTSSLNIVKYAISFTDRDRDFDKDDSVFCVFDRDRNTEEQLARAKRMADSKGIKIIFSNPSFEFWLLLHYLYYNARCESDEIVTRLRDFMPDYNKADPELFLKTKDKISTALGNAKKIIEMQRNRKVEPISRDSNPITFVNQLIEAIYSFKAR
jgi:predicted ATP-dependent endonuclease of OLD family